MERAAFYLGQHAAGPSIVTSLLGSCSPVILVISCQRRIATIVSVRT